MQFSLAFVNQLKTYLEKQMDTLARKFAAAHDMKVKEEIKRLAREYGKLGEPWRCVAKGRGHFRLALLS